MKIMASPKKLLLLLTLMLFACVGVLYAQSASFRYQKREYMIPMRDGVRLYTAVYTPKDKADAPIVMTRTPYGCKPYGDQFINTQIETGFMRCYVDKGYIVVMQDVRGRYMSEGEFEHVRPGDGTVSEQNDTYDTVEFLLHNIEGNNGRVAVVGNSYPGFYTVLAALSGHPAIKAVIPQAPVTNWFMGDDAHHNGVLMLADTFSFLASMDRGYHMPTQHMPTIRFSFKPNQYESFLARYPLRDLSTPVTPLGFWREMSCHPDYDQWWQQRDVCRYLHDVKPAVMVVGGLFDAEDCYGAWETYKAIVKQSPQTETHLVVGPWAHGAWKGHSARKLGEFDFGHQASRSYYLEKFEIPFLERHLRPGSETPDVPLVSVFYTGRNEWAHMEAWDGAPRTRLYLNSDGKVSRRSKTANSREYISRVSSPVPYDDNIGLKRRKEYMIADQRFSTTRDDVLAYVSEPLSEDVTLQGQVKALLRVAISTTDVDFAVRIIDCFPEDDAQKPGFEMLVRAEVMRSRYRESFSRPKPMVPNQIAEVPFTMPDIAHTFRKGHRIMICVQSSWFPIAELSPQQYVDLWRCSKEDFTDCRVRVYDGSYIEFSEENRK